MSKLAILPTNGGKCGICAEPATRKVERKNHTKKITVRCCSGDQCLGRTLQKASGLWKQHLDEAARKAAEHAAKKKPRHLPDQILVGDNFDPLRI